MTFEGERVPSLGGFDVAARGGFQHHFSGDRIGQLVKRLPSTAAAKLSGLQQARDDAMAVASAAYDSQKSAMISRQEKAGRLKNLTLPTRAGGLGALPELGACCATAR